MQKPRETPAKATANASNHDRPGLEPLDHVGRDEILCAPYGASP
jgi:hypothetical protein